MPEKVTAVQHGDKVWTPAVRLPGKRHYGIWDADRGRFIHNTVPGGVQYSSPTAFVNGSFYIEKRPASGFAEAVVRRARKLLGTPYDLLNFNCEQFVNLVADGEKRSPQLQGAMATATLAGIVAFALSAIGGPSYDPIAERYRDKSGRFTRR